MKPTIDKLKETFEYALLAFDDSRYLAETVKELYDGKHYTQKQIDVMRRRGQPVEQFNIIRAYGNLLLGYLNSIGTNIRVEERSPHANASANVLSDVLEYTLKQAKFKTVKGRIRLEGLLTGLMASYVTIKQVIPTAYNLNEHQIGIDYIPYNEIVGDPDARKLDYSDGRFIHRFKWVVEDELLYLFGKTKTEAIKRNSNGNEVVAASSVGGESIYRYSTAGRYTKEQTYLIVHSIVKDDSKLWSVYWTGDTIIYKVELSQYGLPNPYNLMTVSNSDKAYYYGVFEGLTETQIAINQAITQIQLMANGSKVYVQTGAVSDIQGFRDAYNRVNAVIPVLNVKGIKDVDKRPDIQQQYMIINSALDRIKQQIGINEAFLGMAFSADSGKKVQLQRQATMMSLSYITDKIVDHTQCMGETLINYIKVFYDKPMILSVTDEHNSKRWIEANKPIVSEDGNPALLYEEDSNGEPKYNEQGQYLAKPVYEADTEFKFTDVDVNVVLSETGSDEDNQYMLDTYINGSVGQMLAQVAPDKFLKLAGLSALNMKTKYSTDIAELLQEVQQQMGGQQGGVQQGGQPPMLEQGQGVPVQQRGSLKGGAG